MIENKSYRNDMSSVIYTLKNPATKKKKIILEAETRVLLVSVSTTLQKEI